MSIQGAARAAETTDQRGGAVGLHFEGHLAEPEATGCAHEFLRQHASGIAQQLLGALAERHGFVHPKPPGMRGALSAEKNVERSSSSLATKSSKPEIAQVNAAALDCVANAARHASGATMPP